MLLGTTLSGKTTLMQLMAGIQKPSSGTIRFRGKDVTGVAVQQRNVSMVYQQFINYPNFSVYDNIASPLKVAGMDKAEIERRVMAAAELLRLKPMLKRRPSELSGGQQQRTAIARAIVKDSDLILLDEPLANLDYKLREELRDELPKLFAGRNAIVVYATTEPTEALLFGGNTATLHEGRITQFGPTSSIYRAAEGPHHRAGVLRSADQHGARWRSAATCSMSSAARPGPRAPPPPASPDGAYTLGIRPHHVTPLPSDGDHGRNRRPRAGDGAFGLGKRHPPRCRRRHLGFAVARHPPLRSGDHRQRSMSTSTAACSSRPPASGCPDG